MNTITLPAIIHESCSLDRWTLPPFTGTLSSNTPILPSANPANVHVRGVFSTAISGFRTALYLCDSG